MRDAALPIAMLLLAHAIAIAGEAPRRIGIALMLLVGGATIAALIAPTGRVIEPAFLACWALIILNAVAAWLRGRLPVPVLLGLACASGLAIGLLGAAANQRVDLVRASPVLLAILPARWIIGRRGEIVLRVAIGWLVAIALLGAVLPIVPMPGYRKDHME